MNVPAASLLGACVQALRTRIQPEVQGAEARTQLAAIVDLLSKLQRTVEWSAEIRAEQASAYGAGLQALQQAAQAHGLAAPAAGAGPEACMRELSDWLFSQVPAGALRDELDRLMQAALREAVAAERRHIPRTDFSTMTEDAAP